MLGEGWFWKVSACFDIVFVVHHQKNKDQYTLITALILVCAQSGSIYFVVVKSFEVHCTLSILIYCKNRGRIVSLQGRK